MNVYVVMEAVIPMQHALTPTAASGVFVMVASVGMDMSAEVSSHFVKIPQGNDFGGGRR